MDFALLVTNLLNPPVLFFGLGLIAAWVRSDLELPQPVPKLLSLYLLLAIGYKGGVEIAQAGLDPRMALVLATSVVVAFLTPLYVFWLIRRHVGPADAAAVAAAYGSVSAVTFITATSLLSKLGVAYSGYMVAAMALMESPAIIVGILLARRFAPNVSDAPVSLLGLLREAFCNGSVIVLLGSLGIGLLTAGHGETSLKPFVSELFSGVLCLFLLDMGLVSGHRLLEVGRLGAFPVAFALLIPPVNAAVGILVARLLGCNPGDALLFATLCASASYIAVPAAVRHAIPEANPALYVTMSLAITFPFNVALGLPLYYGVIRAIWP